MDFNSIEIIFETFFSNSIRNSIVYFGQRYGCRCRTIHQSQNISVNS